MGIINNNRKKIMRKTKIIEANEYIKKNLCKVNPTYRLTYHAMSPIGWSNDPNGLIWYKDKFHLFHQFYPYNASWGPMHWAHQTTTDFIKWNLENVALAPDQPYDKDLGAFSGTSIVINEKLYLMYTAVANNLQQQAIAISNDSINFIKQKSNPVIKSNNLPQWFSINDFRDPKVFKKGNYFYVILGTKYNNHGQLIMFKSANMVDFHYVGMLMNDYNLELSNYLLLDGVYECPDFLEIDGYEMLIVSPQFLPQKGLEHENAHSSVYALGTLNYGNGRFAYSDLIDIDSGFDFYAPQTARLPDGRTIMIAWMQMWDRNFPTQKDNWVGAFTLPRELRIVNDVLYQSPIKEIENYRKNEVSYNNVCIVDNCDLDNVDGKTIELEVEFDIGTASKIGLQVFKNSINSTKIYFDKITSSIVIDRSESGIFIKGAESNDSTRSALISVVDNKVKLRIFLDVSSVEVFINDGIRTLTANVYPDHDANNIIFYVEGGIGTITNIKKYDIVV